MKTNSSPNRFQASTMTEVLIVLAIVVLLACIFLPVITRHSARSKRIECVSNLKQIGLAYRIWSNDCGDKFPWAVPAKDRGTVEFAESTNVFLHYQTASNELSTPKILVCPSDTGKLVAKNFNQFDNRNISYLVGLDADEGKPQTVLSGDRNLSTNGVALGHGVFDLSSTTWGWTTAIHNQVGNIGLSDGSVQQMTPAHMQKQWNVAAANSGTGRLSIP